MDTPRPDSRLPMIYAPACELIARENGSLRWQAIPDWEPVLFDPKGLRIEEWRAQGRLRLVKQGGHRRVYYVRSAERAFYVKQYRRDRLADALGHLLRPSAARREWGKAAEVARRGIPTIRPVAWAEQTRGGIVRDNYLVTEAIEPACSLERYVTQELPKLPPQARQSTRQRLLERVARFVAAIHRAGIVHDDFHAGNVLVRLHTRGPDAPDDELPELHLIDVPGVRFSRPLNWRASRASLIMFTAGWWERTSPSERLRFWRTYLLHRPDLEVPHQRTAIGQLERGSRPYSKRVARRRDKRALRTNRDYLALHRSGSVAHGVVDLPRAELGRLLEDPEALLNRNLHSPVKLSHAKLIVQAELPLAAGPVHVAYARCRFRNCWKAFLGRFRRGRALHAWIMGHALRARGIATPRPIAVCRVRRRWPGSESYLATEWIEGAENLHLYGWRMAALSPSDRLARAARCAESLGRLIGRMHAYQISHGDLKASNVLVVEQDAKITTYLIDAEDVRIARRLTSTRRVRDLARLAASIQAHPWVTRAVFCRFFRAYLRQFPGGAVAWKPLWGRVARQSRRIIRRKRRRGGLLL